MVFIEVRLLKLSQEKIEFIETLLLPKFNDSIRIIDDPGVSRFNLGINNFTVYIS